MFLKQKLTQQFNYCTYRLAWNPMREFYSNHTVSAMCTHNFSNKLIVTFFPDYLLPYEPACQRCRINRFKFN